MSTNVIKPGVEPKLASTACTTLLRTAAWYGDQIIPLDFPAEWDVRELWPETPHSLTDEEIAACLENPAGQLPIKKMCQGKSRPLIVVDDLNRPTPASRVLPFLLRQFGEAGISSGNVRILMAGGSHGRANSDAVSKKVGAEAAASCQLMVHDCRGDLVNAGITSFGTPIFVNKEVVSSDFVIGIGGIYPNHTAAFGGGSKLALGVLGLRSIMHLHYRHKAMGWGGFETDSSFRKDLDEIAAAIRLNTTIALQINADRSVIRLDCGDHRLYYKEAVAFARRTFGTAIPSDPDVVISNAYPNDLSLTFARMKGMAPLRYCRPDASRVAIASCCEGVGEHGLFPLIVPRFHRVRSIFRQLLVLRPSEIGRKFARRLKRQLPLGFARRGQRRPSMSTSTSNNPILLYRPGSSCESLPVHIRGMRVTTSWAEVLQTIQKEQGGRKNLKVLIYPCAPLQSFNHYDQ
jgi:nickel-dependent lactate racemase